MSKSQQATAAFDKFANCYQSHSYDEIFANLLDCLMYVASAGKEFKKEYTAAVKLYGEAELTEFIGYLADISAGFYDVLGELYEHIRSSYKASKLGQFFTPQPVSEMMATIVGVKYEGKPMAFADPAGCGSGRNILAMAKAVAETRWQHQFFGIDIDRMCVKMAVVNCWLQTVPAMIIHGDGLGITYWAAYEVVLNWDAATKSWVPFVVCQPAEVVQALEGIARKDVTQQIATEVNAARVANLEAHRAKREAEHQATPSPIVEFLKAVEAPLTTKAVEAPLTHANPPDDKTHVAEEKAAVKPAQTRRKGKQPPHAQHSLF